MHPTIAMGVVAGLAGLASAVPSGCDATVAGSFELTAIPRGTVPHKKRAAVCGGDSTLVMSLTDSVLTDASGRIGYISSSDQLQFDKPAQSGFKAADGFSICGDGTIALGDSTDFWACKSGPFSNIYSAKIAPQCRPIHLGAIACGDDAADIPAPVDSPVASTVVPAVSYGIETTIPTALPIPLCQIHDGQVQEHMTPCDEVELDTVTIGTSTPTAVPTTMVPTPYTTPTKAPTPYSTPTEPVTQPGLGVRDTVEMVVVCVVGFMSTMAIILI